MDGIKRALAIYGGPRRHKNTEQLLDAIIKGMKSDKIAVERLILCDKNILPCVSCYYCAKGNGCFKRDDMDEIYEKLQSSDIVLFSCPVYFAGIPGGAKCMIDRCQAFWCSKQIPEVRESMKRKSGYFLATSGRAGEDIFKPASETVKLFFASFNCSYSGDFFASGTDSLQVEENSSILDEAIRFGKKISEDNCHRGDQ